VEVAADMPSLPRIGARLWLADEPAEGAPVSWLGLGPRELSGSPARRRSRSLAIAHRGVAHPLCLPDRQWTALRYPPLHLGIWRWRGASTSVSAATVSSSWPKPVTRPIWWLWGHAPVPRWLPHGGGRRRLLEPERAARVLAVAGSLSVALPSGLAGPAVARWRDSKAVSHVTI
jgi:hypothetical protein